MYYTTLWADHLVDQSDLRKKQLTVQLELDSVRIPHALHLHPSYGEDMKPIC